MTIMNANEGTHVVFSVQEKETNKALMIKIEPSIYKGNDCELYVRNNSDLSRYVDSVGGMKAVYLKEKYNLKNPDRAIQVYNELIEEEKPKFGGELLDPIDYLFEYDLVEECDEMEYELVDRIAEFDGSNILLTHDTGRVFLRVQEAARFAGLNPLTFIDALIDNPSVKAPEWTMQKLQPYEMREYRRYESDLVSKFPSIMWRDLRDKDHLLEAIVQLSPLKSATYKDAIKVYNKLLKRGRND